MYNVQDIVFEVGRKCNLRCPHCLRGCSQDIAIKDKYIVDKIVERNIAVGNFFVATNGLVRSMDVVTSLLRLYEICDEKEHFFKKIRFHRRFLVQFPETTSRMKLPETKLSYPNHLIIIKETGFR